MFEIKSFRINQMFHGDGQYSTGNRFENPSCREVSCVQVAWFQVEARDLVWWASTCVGWKEFGHVPWAPWPLSQLQLPHLPLQESYVAIRQVVATSSLPLCK